MTLSSRRRFDIEDAPSDADVEVLPNGLEAFNDSRWPGHQPWKALAVFVRDGQSIVAGLSGGTYCGWLFVRYLWVSDALRGKGIGRELMSSAEAHAFERGCHSAWVDTFSFQAPGFYLKLGYEVFGELDYPPEHKRFFFKKRLGGGVRRGRLRAVRSHIARRCAVLRATQRFQALNLIFLQLAKKRAAPWPVSTAHTSSNKRLFDSQPTLLSSCERS